MSVRFRPYDRERRFVWPVPFSRAASEVRWLAIHRTPPDWKALFTRALDLMLIASVGAEDALMVGNEAGRLCWRGPSSWSIIDVDLGGMSDKKQAVVKAALLKAARYAR